VTALSRRLLLAAIASALAALAACGQMGPLTLPDDADRGQDDAEDDEQDER